MKNFLTLIILIIIFFSTNNAKLHAKNYKIGDVIEDVLYI